MIKLEKRLMPFCEHCDDFAPCAMKLKEKTENGESLDIKVLVMCVQADICFNAINKYTNFMASCQKPEEDNIYD